MPDDARAAPFARTHIEIGTDALVTGAWASLTELAVRLDVQPVDLVIGLREHLSGILRDLDAARLFEMDTAAALLHGAFARRDPKAHADRLAQYRDARAALAAAAEAPLAGEGRG